MSPVAGRPPRVLLSTWRRQGRVFGPVLRDMYGVEVGYPAAVQRAGALAYLVPQAPHHAAASEVVVGFDGLLLIGGEDLSADVSGVAPETVGANASTGRDEWELALLQASLAADLPVLAVCRGMQLLNVACGGTLLGDIAEMSADHPAVPAETEVALSFRHQVRLLAGSIIADVAGSDTVETNSLHHQALDRVGDGLIVTGRTRDGLVEAVELPTARWCVGVQWHPELMADDPVQRRLLEQFVAACARRTT